MLRILSLLLLALAPVLGADRFTGWQSCASSGCHGGGKGDDQLLIWQKKDPHARAHGILIAERSKRIGEALGIPEPAKSTQCIVCHSPMQSAAPERLSTFIKAPNRGVSCETCHGPAENWLRLHTRTDVTHAQRISAGMRDLDTTYQRANSCVGCHANLEPELRKAGHPELRFELARQLADMPPHWDDENTPPAAAWLTSQAVLLRELAWQAEKGAPDVADRIAALLWLLRETPSGADTLPTDPKALGLRKAADALAKSTGAAKWNTAKTRAQFDRIAALAPSLDAASGFRKAEVLAPALRALTMGLGTDALIRAKDPLLTMDILTRNPVAFDPKRFAEAVAQLSAAATTTTATTKP